MPASEAILRDVHEPLQVHNQPLGQTENCKTSIEFQTERQDERINPTLVLSIQGNSTLRKPPKTEKLRSVWLRNTPVVLWVLSSPNKWQYLD